MSGFWDFWIEAIKRAKGAAFLFVVTIVAILVLALVFIPTVTSAGVCVLAGVILLIIATAALFLYYLDKTSQKPQAKKANRVKQSKAIRCPKCNVVAPAVRVGGVDRCPNCAYEYMSNEKTAKVIGKWVDVGKKIPID